MPEYLVTSRFHLRPIQDSDLPALFRNFSDPALMQFYDLAPIRTLAEMKDLVARWRRWEGKGTGKRWAIALKDTDEAIGTCGFRDIDMRVRCAEAGCELSREYWGRGVMPEVAPFLGRYAFEELALNHIKAFVAPGNRASIALLEKFGFRKKRLVRDRVIINGKGFDMLYFTMTRAAYRAKVHPQDTAPFEALTLAIREQFIRFAQFLGTRVSWPRAR